METDRDNARLSCRNAESSRSLLFVPGDRADRFDKAIASGADAVICDLEDSVLPHHKQTARSRVADWLSGSGAACVRINPPKSAHCRLDYEAIANLPGLRAVVVPKADDVDELASVHAALGPDIPLVALIETAMGIHRAYEIASAAGVVRLAFGSLDYSLDTGVEQDDISLLYARSALVVASRAARIAGPIDAITAAIDDPGEAEADARRGRRLGFSGKLCIHPRQVAGVNAAFAPAEDEVRWARRVAEVAADVGVARVDGQMIDKPVMRRAERILREAAERDESTGHSARPS